MPIFAIEIDQNSIVEKTVEQLNQKLQEQSITTSPLNGKVEYLPTFSKANVLFVINSIFPGSDLAKHAIVIIFGLVYLFQLSLWWVSFALLPLFYVWLKDYPGAYIFAFKKMLKKNGYNGTIYKVSNDEVINIVTRRLDQ